jgi:hypothetical protein
MALVIELLEEALNAFDRVIGAFGAGGVVGVFTPVIHGPGVLFSEYYVEGGGLEIFPGVVEYLPGLHFYRIFRHLPMAPNPLFCNYENLYKTLGPC